MTQRPDSPTAPMPYAINLRVASAHYRGLMMLAHSRGTSLAQVVRDSVERELRSLKNADGVTFWDALVGDENLTLTADELADLEEIERASS